MLNMKEITSLKELDLGSSSVKVVGMMQETDWRMHSSC